MFRSFITIAAVAGLAAGASAQQQMPAVSLQPVSNLQYGSYDFNNGFTVTNGGNRAIGPDTLFDTTGNVAYYYGVIGADTTKQEWMDETQLPNRASTLGNTEQITGMAWIYCEGGYTAYFDAVISLYNDTVACAGSSSWVPGQPSFADCLYGIAGLPGSGCWIVTVDLSCGFECVLPDASNPLSGAQGTIGWSVTPFNCNASPFLGPFLGKQANATPGSQDLFEWRSWNVNYFGAYTYGGCYWFGGIPHARADFHVAFYGAAADVTNCYGSNALDTLCLEAVNAVENGSAWNFNVTGVTGGSTRYFLLVQPDPQGTDPGCDQATMNGNGGQFTRQVSVPSTMPFSMGLQSADFSGALGIPNNPSNAHVIFQVVSFPTSGSITPSNVRAASNGIDTTL